eukprot:6172430-Pleurochrysis_carterae.AAC.2
MARSFRHCQYRHFAGNSAAGTHSTCRRVGTLRLLLVSHALSCGVRSTESANASAMAAFALATDCTCIIPIEIALLYMQAFERFYGSRSPSTNSYLRILAGAPLAGGNAALMQENVTLTMRTYPVVRKKEDGEARLRRPDSPAVPPFKGFQQPRQQPWRPQAVVVLEDNRSKRATASHHEVCSKYGTTRLVPCEHARKFRRLHWMSSPYS